MRPIFAALSLSLLAACHAPATPRPATTPNEAKADDPVEVVLPQDGEAAKTDGRQPGDYCTLRFSGSYREAPVELTQRVAERRDHRLLIDIEMGGAPRLRLEIDDRPEHRGKMLSVWVHDDEAGLVEADVEAYEELMAEVMLTADVNEGLLAEEKVELILGDEPAEATKSTFRVRIGEQLATMSTFAIVQREDGRDWAWGDAGGEMRTAEGKLLFRAEVVALGRDGHGAMAASEEGDAVEGLDAFDE